MKTITRLADLTPDPHNANKGTKRGLDILEHSLERNGIGRSVLADRNGILIGGNKTVERIADLTSGDVEVIVVKTNGRQLVVVQRADLDLTSETDPRARELALADNRASELGLDWDPNALLHHMPGVDIGGYFFDRELASIFGEADEKGELAPLPDNTKHTTSADTAEEPPAASTTAAGDTAGGITDGAPAHDPADEDQTICPECGHSW